MFDKVKRVVSFETSDHPCVSVGFFTRVYITLKAWGPKSGLVLQLCSYQCGRRAISRVTHPSTRLAFLFGDKT